MWAPAVAPLLGALKNENKDVRWGSIKALGDIKDPRAAAPLIALLTDPTWEIRWISASSLGKLNDRQAVPPLIKALKDEKEKEEVRAVVVQSLQTLTGQKLEENTPEAWSAWWEKEGVKK
jgi:HEAT repeat protein